MTHQPNFGAVLPKGWPKRVRTAVIHVCALAHTALVTSRGWAANHRSAEVRLKTEVDRLLQEVALLQEEIRIKDARMARIPAPQRPHYPPTERLAILELRASRGWSLTQVASRLLVSPATVSSWMRRLGEEGPTAVVQLPTPVNKFPEFVAYIVRRLKLLCPSLGYKKIAQVLGREGLHLGATTVRRMLREKGTPGGGGEPVAERAPGRRIVGRYPNHVWHCDLTNVPTSLGLWVSWFPFSFPQRWPYCWWVAVVADHVSRRLLGFEVFKGQPSAREMRKFLRRVVRESGGRPRVLVTDQGRQFRERGFRAWCARVGIRQWFGAIGQFGSIAVVERLIQTMKRECTRRIVVSYSRAALREELSLFGRWYNGLRPHERLSGATPDEAYSGASTARPRGAGAVVDVRVRFLDGRRHLPVVALDRAA